MGGRCWTIRGKFADGQIAEHGGELIDQGHTQIRHLARSLGLKLDNLLSAEVNGTEPHSPENGDATQRAEQFLEQIEPVLPGITPKWNGKATLDY